MPFGSRADTELPKTGTLAASKTGGYGGTTLPGEWGGTDFRGEGESPLSGSISKVNNTEWLLKVFNNSEDRYSVNLSVIQYDERNKKLKRNNFSHSLKGGEQLERIIRASPRTAHCAVNLTNWRKFPKKVSREEIQAEINQKEQELKALRKQLER